MAEPPVIPSPELSLRASNEPAAAPGPADDPSVQYSTPAPPIFKQDSSATETVAIPLISVAVPADDDGDQQTQARRWFLWVQRATSASASLVAHMMLVLILGLWMFAGEPRELPLLLTSQWAEGLGEAEQLDDPEPTLIVEDPGLLDPEAVEVEEPFSSNDVMPELVTRLSGSVGDLATDAALASSPGEVHRLLRGRSPEARAALVLREGGNEFSEQAVALGLKWLALHQHEDGHWSLDGYNRVDKCRGRCKGAGGRSDTAATALALLPFLGAGQTHRTGDYTDEVGRALTWLMKQQASTGDLRGRGVGRMYAHGMATIALVEAYAMTQDEELRAAAQKAIDFIVGAQHSAGGWRYSPGEPGDTSVFGWQIMALRSAQLAYMNVPEETLERAARYLDSAGVDHYGARYSYMPRGRATPSMTAEGLLCRQYSGWGPNHPGIDEGVRYLLNDHIPRRQEADFYYWYYGTQMMHHVGGQPWNTWNHALRDLVIDMQQKGGHEAGSWDPVGPFSGTGGRIYTTSLALCILEVYYRHLPLYREMAVDR